MGGGGGARVPAAGELGCNHSACRVRARLPAAGGQVPRPVARARGSCHTPGCTSTEVPGHGPVPFRLSPYALSHLPTLPPPPTCACCAEAVEEMAGLGGIEYPLGGTCVLFGVALMVLLEHTAHIMHAPQQAHAHAHGPAVRGGPSSNSHSHSHSHSDDGSGHGPDGSHSGHGHGPKLHGPAAAVAAAAAAAASSPSAAKGLELSHPQLYSNHPDLESGVGGLESHKQQQPHQHHHQAHDTRKASHEGQGQQQQHPQPTPAGTGAGLLVEAEAEVGHSHVCVSRGPASNWLSANAAELVGGLRLRVVAYMFEMGCIFHRWAGGRRGGGAVGRAAACGATRSAAPLSPCSHSAVALRRRRWSGLWCGGTGATGRTAGRPRRPLTVCCIVPCLPFPPPSFIIGLSLGVNKTDKTEVRALLIALAFHQWLEVRGGGREGGKQAGGGWGGGKGITS